MAVTTTSGPQQQVAMPAVDLRQAMGGLVTSEGVRLSTDLSVNQRAAGANMSVDVNPGTAYITDDHAGGGGVYSYSLSAVSNVAVTGADPTNPRVDRVVIRVRDQALGDAANDIAPFVVTGTPTAGATLTNTNGAAAVPGSSLLVANILIPASGTSVTNANIDTVGTANNSPRVRPVVNGDIAYNEFTSNVTSAATTEAGAVQIVSTPAITYDGLPVWVEFFSPSVTHSVANTNIYFDLFDSGTPTGILGRFAPSQAAGGGAAVYVKRRFTPSAASHTYKVSVFTDAATATIGAGASGAGVLVPGFIRITKA